MSKFCIAEIVVLLIGWLSNLFFLAYAEGFFSSYFGRDAWLMDEDFLRFAAILAFPYLLTFLCCWFSRRFVKGFLMLSLLLTIGSICVYYGFFVAPRPLDGGWIFLMVPLVQTMVVVAFSLVIFVISLVFRPKMKPTPA